MKIEPVYVTFEQAELLKEKGFDVKTKKFFDLISSNEINDAPLGDYNLTKQSISIPEQWQVVEWLRVNHGIWVWVKPYKDHAADNNDPIQHQMNVYKNGVTVSKQFDSHEEAYSAAFDYVLKGLM